MRNRKAVAFLFVALTVFIAHSYAQMAKKERLDINPGFRNFQFKTPKEKYTATYSFQRNTSYHWPDIVEIYSADYSVDIASTRTDSLHLFFLGNRLVRTTVFLRDTIPDTYLFKYFGVPDSSVVSSSARVWKAATVTMETKTLFSKPCLDLYLNDFIDMMQVFSK